MNYSEPGESGPTAARVFDLDTGKQIPGTAEAPGIVNSAGPNYLTGLAVSASGSRLAIAFQGRVSVFDLRARPVSQIASFYDGDIAKRHPSIAFAEESVVAVWNAERDFKPMIRFWDLGTASQIQALGDSSQDTYGDFGLSGDGRTVLDYSEKREDLDPKGNCPSLQLKSKLAHFTLWDRPSGKIIAQSPALKFVHNFQGNLWGCHTESDEGPVLNISQTGMVVAADCQSSGFEQLPMRVFTLKWSWWSRSAFRRDHPRSLRTTLAVSIPLNTI